MASKQRKREQGRERQRRYRARRLGDGGQWLYVVAIEGSANGPVKIGVTNELAGRLAALQCGNHRRLFYAAVHRIEDRGDLFQTERRLHRALDPFRLVGEWFAVSVEAAVAVAAASAP
jgi:hypothetical protein